jgi:hypothetical protein
MLENIFESFLIFLKILFLDKNWENIVLFHIIKTNLSEDADKKW